MLPLQWVLALSLVGELRFIMVCDVAKKKKKKNRNTKIINLSSPLCHWWLKRHNTVFSLELTELRRCFDVFSILMFKTFSFLELLGWNFWELFIKIEILEKLQNWRR